MRKVLFTTILLIAMIGSVFAQRTVTGIVTDASDGSGIPGVNIQVKGTSTGTVTDVSGNYSIDVPDDNAVLKFSFIGYTTQEIAVGGNSTINVNLQPTSVGVDEVVVTALGISREKKALGYAVTEVGGDEINQVKETNVINQLSGRVAGVVITRSAAGPGAGSRVIIRGNNSLTGENQPLYVVDGIPVDNSGFGTAAGTGTANYRRTDYGTGISDINPDDIESISVLKGPNAAALYGARASNGVILITTKKGTKGKGLGVTYRGSYTFENPLLLPEYQNEYGQGREGIIPDYEQLLTTGGSWGPKLDGSSQLYFTGENRPYSAQEDNVRNFFRTGATISNTLALDYGSDNATMRFSYTNLQANSILENSGINKHNFNLRGTANLNKRLSLDAKVTYFMQDATNRPDQGTEGIMAYVYDIPRNLDMADLEDFQNPDYSTRSYTSSGGNPYWILHHDINDDTRTRINGFAKATYKFADFLSAFVRVGTDHTTQEIENVTQYGHWFFQSGRLSFNTRTVTETNADFLLMFNKEFGDFTVSANAGGNLRYDTYKYYGISGEDFKIPTKPILQSCAETFTGYTPLREKRVNSLYGTATLDFRRMVYLDITARNDWSSALPEDSWSYFYPSVGVSVLLNEAFGIESDILSFSKVRASWAQVGKDTGPYQLTNSFSLSSSTSSYLGLTVLNRPGTYYVEDLKPEQSSSIEVGAEVRMFNNRLFADFSYYDISSTDLIMQIPVSASTGYSSFNTNVGEITNKGIELMIGGTPVRTKGFSWEVALNMATNENELVELIEDLDNYEFSTTNAGNVLVSATVGGGFGEIWGTDFKRTDDGRIIVDDMGRPQASSEKVLLGNYQPDWTGGLTNTFRYKGITLRALIDFRIGGQVYSGSDAGLDAMGVSKRSLEYREEGGLVVDGVVNTGTPEDPVYETNTANVSAQDYWGAMSGIVSNYIYDQTNIRLRELTISYNLPQKVLANTFIKKASIGLVGRNLFFLYKEIDNFDPESSYSTSNYAQGMLWYNLPTTRSFGFNVNISF